MARQAEGSAGMSMARSADEGRGEKRPVPDDDDDEALMEEGGEGGGAAAAAGEWSRGTCNSRIGLW